MELETKKIGNVKDLECLKKVLVVLMGKLDSAKYKTELIKLCFILDYEYCQENHKKEGPTTVEYIKYNYGPYSDSFIDAFDSLRSEGIICEVSLPFGEGFQLNKRDGALEVSGDLARLVDEVIIKYGKKSLRDMKNYIYNLKEFKDTKFGSPIVLCE